MKPTLFSPYGVQVQMPPAHGTFKQAQKVKTDVGVQGALDLDALPTDYYGGCRPAKGPKTPRLIKTEIYNAHASA